MLLKKYSPTFSLKDYVQYYEIVRFMFDSNLEIPIKPFAPRPETTLCFYPRDLDHISDLGKTLQIIPCRTVIFGQQTIMKIRRPGQDFLLIMVVFQPGALYRLTGVPQYLLTDSYVDADLILTKEVLNVIDSLNVCQSYSQMIDIIETYLLELIQKSSRSFHHIYQAASLMIAQSPNLSIDWFAKEACLSLRQFERKFKNHVGISASQLARISKFDRTVKMKNAQPHLDWLSIALACGYYDYQHLVRDYKEFTGMTPPSFFNLDINAPERLFGLYEESKIHTF